MWYFVAKTLLFSNTLFCLLNLKIMLAINFDLVITANLGALYCGRTWVVYEEEGRSIQYWKVI